MRIEPELTYQDYKDGVVDAFHLLGDKGWDTAEKITNYMTDEDNELLLPNSTSLALWIISIGEYEVKHNLLEDRVLEQLSYHIPRFKMGKYVEDLTSEEYKQVSEDVEYILSKVKLIKVNLDDDLEE